MQKNFSIIFVSIGYLFALRPDVILTSDVLSRRTRSGFLIHITSNITVLVLCGGAVQCFCDNAAMVAILNSGTSKTFPL